MPILPAIFDTEPLPTLNNVGGVSIAGADPSATVREDAAAAATLQSAIRGMRRYTPSKITSLYNQPNVANSPRFARSTFYGGDSVGDPILPGFTPPTMNEGDGAGPVSLLFPQTGEEVDPLQVLPTNSNPVEQNPDNILVPPKPEGLPEEPLDENNEGPPVLEEPVADPTAMNDIYRRFNPGRLYRIFSV